MPANWKHELSHFKGGETVSGANVRQARKRPNLNIMKGILPNLQDALQKVNARLENAQDRLDGANNLFKILKSTKHELSQHNEEIMKAAFVCLDDFAQELRAVGYRILRYLINDTTIMKSVWHYGLEFYILKALVRDQKGEIEREQAFKLVRAFIDVHGGLKFLPRGVISVLISVAEQGDDKFKNLALVTLCEISVKDL